ncbi:unnamed protein product [Clavelina lepadiformis]|uniref:Uncharacterized protein n=1 Tax=Clavelina lepadiformis TaxID=159417 RepID=A0ABP0F2N7_CLALP
MEFIRDCEKWSCDAWLSYNELLNGHWISFTMVDERHAITGQQPVKEKVDHKTENTKYRHLWSQLTHVMVLSMFNDKA